MSHWNAVVKILRHLKKAPRKRLLYSDCDHTQVTIFHIQIRQTYLSIGDQDRLLCICWKKFSILEK